MEPTEKLISEVRSFVQSWHEEYPEDLNIDDLEDALDEVDGLPPRHATERAEAEARWKAGEPERKRKKKEREKAEAFAAEERAKWTAAWDENLGGVREALEHLNELSLADLRAKAGIE